MTRYIFLISSIFSIILADSGIYNNCLENELIALPSGLCSEDDLEILDQEDGEVIKNVTAAQRIDGSKLVDIYYDLEGVEPYSLSLIHI